jgi:hypothetical protein
MKQKQSVPVLVPFLIVVSILFIGFLIFCYVETKKANPQMIQVGSGRCPTESSAFSDSCSPSTGIGPACTAS